MASPSTSRAPAVRAPGPATDAQHQELLEALGSALAQLEALDREIVEQRLLRQRTFTEIGTMLALREDAVRMRYNRAMQRLKPLLRAHGSSNGGVA